MRRAAFWALVLILASGVLLAGGKGGGCSGKARPSFQTAPDFSLPLLGGDKSLTLSEISQQHPATLIVFWATWCPTCISEVNTLNQWQERYASRGLQILAIDVEESRDKLEKFAQKHSIRYPCLLDADARVAERYGVDSLPTVVLLAKGGEILYYGFHLPQNIERWLSADLH